MLVQYDVDVLSNIIDKVLIYNDKDIEVVFKGCLLYTSLSNGENYKTAFQKKDELLWTPVAVRRIATNIIYTGTLVPVSYTHLEIR